MRTHLFCEGVVAVEGVLLVVGLTVVVDDVTLFDNDVTIVDEFGFIGKSSFHVKKVSLEFSVKVTTGNE